MARISNLFSRETITAGEGYFDYELQIGRSVVVPWLARRIDLEGLAVGDFGCHQGGVLQALREAGVGSGIGLELDAAHLEASPFEQDDRFLLEVRDILTIEPGEFDFGLVVMRDVLEHIPDFEGALRSVAGSLKPCGLAFFSFPPYYSPFGGHQQLASGWARTAPFLHLLPERFFFRLVAVESNAYMTAEDSVSDMRSVRETRLTIGRALAAASSAGLVLVDSEFFLLRPDYEIRYGLRPVGVGPIARMRRLREIVVMGAHLLFRRGLSSF